MGRQPRVIQSDGLPRANNPVTRDMLRAVFGDGKWRTIYDMVIKLGDRIPVEVAIRAARMPKKPTKDDFESRLRSGRRNLVREPVTAAVSGGVFERRKGAHGTEYRCVKPIAYRAKVGSKMAVPDLTRPATSAKCGVSHAAVYKLIEENRDIDVASLADKLALCMRDDEIITRYVNTLVRRQAKADVCDKETARATILTRHDIDSTAFRDAARQYVVRVAISNLIAKKKVTEICFFRVVEP
jgi:hypothetical protein